MRGIAWLVVAVVANAACAPAYVHESVDERVHDSATRHESVPDAVDYRIAPSVRGDSLVLAITRAERCADIEIAHAHRTTHTERELDRKAAITFWVIGGVLGLVGIPTYFDADHLARTQNEQATDMSMMTTPGEVRRAGVALMTIGAAALALAGATHLRAIDSDRDDGVITRDPVRKEYACRERAASGVGFTVLLDSAALSGQTDGTGRAELALTDVADAAVPRAGTAIGVAIGSVKATVALAGNEAAQLEQALASNPMSRLAKDRCAATFGRLAAALARKPGRGEVIEVDKQLKQVKSRCHTPDAEARVSELRAFVTRRALEIFDEERRGAHAAAPP
jgi:hypothetical protein